MVRALNRLAAPLALLGALACGLASPALAQESVPQSPEEAAKKRIGFYFGMSLTKLSALGAANGIAVEIDRPIAPGIPFDVVGPEVDADFRSRLNLEFMVGFRLRDSGSVEATFIQWDEKQDLARDADAGKAFANTLASPLAGVREDLDGDGDVLGLECFSLPGCEPDPRIPDTGQVLDGAEDINFNGVADFLRFDSSTKIVGQAAADYQSFDLDYKRRLTTSRRLTVDWRAGLRMASLSQTYDIGYRMPGSFAVFSDEEADIAVSSWGCDLSPLRPQSNVQDGDGDGETQSTQNEADGDGFLDGNCNNTINDTLKSVATLSEDRIIANIRTRGYGVKAGLEGRFELSKKWRLTGSIGVSLLSTTTEFRYRETFISERDRMPNFIEWDFNADGVYDQHDLDFDGSCANIAAELCQLTTADAAALATTTAGLPYVEIRYRDGIPSSVVAQASGQNRNPYRGSGTGQLREGDSVPESERNSDILRETSILHDVQGDSSGIRPVLDLNVGFEWQFSKFAHVGFGLRSTRWMDAGKFRSIADDVVAGREPEADGDFTLNGAYVTLTVVPR